MAIPTKYQGKSFADIASKIQDKYKDRYDAISIRGLNKEVNDLQAAQEYARAKKEMQEQLEAQMQQPEQDQDPMQQMQSPPQAGGNQGTSFSPTEQQPTFQREASSDYNEKFAYGGNMTNQYFDGGEETDDPTTNNQGIQTPNVNVQGIDLSDNLAQQEVLQNELNSESQPFNFSSKQQMVGGLGLMAAPLVSNLIQGITMKQAPNVPVRQVSNQGLSGLRNFRARESRFDNIDLDNIERGITEASGRFTQNNVNASRGNAGAFVANELGNQNNLYRSIADARMKAQIADRETDQLNASERARVDSMNLQKESQVASLQGRNDLFNAQMQAQGDVQNQQNAAAFQSFRSDLLNSAAGSVANIGSTMFGAGQMGQMSGYDIFGQYIKKLEAEKAAKTNKKAYGGLSTIKKKRKKK